VLLLSKVCFKNHIFFNEHNVIQCDLFKGKEGGGGGIFVPLGCF
jgi:hypothetical protein